MVPCERPETRIHLPDSKSSSTNWSELGISPNESKSSLEVILERGIPSIDTELDLPASVPLHQSRPESLRKLEGESREPSSLSPISTHGSYWRSSALPGVEVPFYDYEFILRRAAEVFQHLKHGRIRAESRHPYCLDSISYIDLPLPGYCFHLGGNLMEGNKGHYEHSIRRVPEYSNQRLIIVEDLSLETIHFLGRQFGVSPEFFEEHLLNSGYEGANYNDLPASTWTAAGMNKSHVSVKWHRPVLRLPEPPFSKQDLRDLLDPEVGNRLYRAEINQSKHFPNRDKHLSIGMGALD